MNETRQDCRKELKCLARDEVKGTLHTCEKNNEHPGKCRCSCGHEWLRGHWE